MRPSTARPARLRVPLAAFLIVCLLGAGGRLALAQADGLAPDERAEIEEVVRAYLLENPQVIVEALEILQAREQAAERRLQQESLVERRDEVFDSPRSPVIGNPEGDITLVEFFDYQCGYCKRMVDQVFQLTEEDPDLRIVLKEFPILGPGSVMAARAALAAGQQGLYAELHNALMQHRGALDEETILGLAAEVGLDVERLRADMDSPEVAAEIEANLALAEALGIRGTPAFIVGDRVVPGAVGYEMLKSLIDSQRAG